MTSGARYLLRNSINLNVFRSVDSRSARCHHDGMTRKPGRQPGTAADRRMPNGHPSSRQKSSIYHILPKPGKQYHNDI